jgi:hypothetical protein
MLPIMRKLDIAPGPMAVKQLRDSFGKGAWKALCATSPTKLIKMGKTIAAPAYASTSELLKHASRLPSTLLTTVGELRAFTIQEAEFLANLAEARPQPYKNTHYYKEACDNFTYLERFGADYGARPHPRMTAEQVARLHNRVVLQRMHDRQEKYRAAIADYDTEFTLMRKVPRALSSIDGKLTATLLMTKRAYDEQGRAQNHCVGGYGEDGALEKCYVYSITDQSGEIVSTVMFSAEGNTLQHYGKYNQRVENTYAVQFVDRLERLMVTA